MTPKEIELMHKFKSLVEERLHVHSMTVFGSRARGDAHEDSDLDVLVVIEEEETPGISQYISDCAWDACFDTGILLTPVIFSRRDWEEGPERSGLLAQAIRHEGIPV